MSRVPADDVLSRPELEHTHRIKKLLSSFTIGEDARPSGLVSANIQRSSACSMAGL